MNQTKKYNFLFFLFLFISNITYCQEQEHYIWVFADTAYVISDLTDTHDTILSLSWMDSIPYISKYGYDYSYMHRYDNTWWFKCFMNSDTGWIKYSDASLVKKVLKSDKGYAFIRQAYSNGLPYWDHIVILNSDNELRKDFNDIGFDQGLWISPEYFLFNGSMSVYVYSYPQNNLIRLDTAREFIWNKDLMKVISIFTSKFYPKKISISSINIDGTGRQTLFSIDTNITQLGLDYDDYDFIDFKIEKYNGIDAYSFWVTTSDREAKIYIDWEGHHLSTTYH